ncbi:MAG TPA: PHB depolymerase family esterase [Acidimicrobiales bacterium]|nr:PHB depolymerase family esterase [Acidimicrobiales bacterium]
MGAKHRLPARQAGLIAALLVVAACSGGDGDTAASTPTSTTTTTTAAPCSTVEPGEGRVDLGERWYLRHVPDAHDGTTPLPLVVDLHGYSEGAELHASRTGVGDLGAREGFVTITPHALGDIPAWDLAVDGIDVAFVADVIDDAEASLCIDPDRIYVTGHSMGGFLISTLACSPVANRIAAFAPVSGVRLVEPCDPPRTAPALIIHGRDDDVVLYDGGLSPLAADALDLPEEGPSIAVIVEAWPGGDARLHTVAGGHGWPRDATEELWAFFERHSLR